VLLSARQKFHIFWDQCNESYPADGNPMVWLYWLSTKLKA